MWHPPRRRAGERGFSLVELVTTMLILGVLSAMALPAYAKLRQRFCDAAALTDVTNVGQAVEAMDSSASFSVTVLGPSAIRQVPGPRVSKGTTLLVTRTVTRVIGNGNANGNANLGVGNGRGKGNAKEVDSQPVYQVVGTHKGGSGVSYIFTGGKVYAAKQ